MSSTEKKARRNPVKYTFSHAHEVRFSVAVMCRVFKVARSDGNPKLSQLADRHLNARF